MAIAPDWFTVEHGRNGGTLLLVAAMIGIAIWIIPRLFRLIAHRKTSGLSIREIFASRDEPEIRMMSGFALACAGVAANKAPIFPFYVLLIAKKYETAGQYADWSFLWVGPSYLMIIIGCAMVMWDVFHKFPRKLACTMVVLTGAMVWLAGVLLTQLLVNLF